MGGYVVTGASSGIGLAIASALVSGGHRVFGTVRRHDDGDRLATELGDRFVPLVTDVTDEKGLAAAAEQVAVVLAGEPLAGLVNNAGIALAGPLLEQQINVVQAHFEVNLLGPLRAARAFAPLMAPGTVKPPNPARIINISSTAGRFGAPFLGAYAASKHALEGMSQALRRELIGSGIDVIVVAPGAVRTPIWDKAEANSGCQETSRWAGPWGRFEAMMYARGRNGMSPDAIARVVLEALTARRPRARYTVDSSAAATALFALLPARAQDRLLARVLGMQSLP